MVTNGKIVFFHMNQLGDLLFSLPVLKAARKKWKNIKIISVVKSELAPLLRESGFVDEVKTRGHGGIKEKLNLIRSLRCEDISRAVLFSESPASLMISYFASIPERIGFQSASLKILLTGKARRNGVPSLRNNENLGRLIGIDEIDPDYAGLVTVPETEIKSIESWFSCEGIAASKIIVISPCSSGKRKEKRWDPEKWLKLTEILSAKGFFPVITGAPCEENELKSMFASSTIKVRLFTAPSGILSLAALFLKAKVFIGIDSGAMHLAASLKLPVIALFGPTDPEQVGPRPLNKHVIIQKSSMSDINVDEVLEKICAQLI